MTDNIHIDNKLKLLYLILFVFLIMGNQSNAQETKFKQTSIRTGIGINPKNSRLAYEFRPINVQFENDYFILGYLMLGLDIKLKKQRIANNVCKK